MLPLVLHIANLLMISIVGTVIKDNGPMSSPTGTLPKPWLGVESPAMLLEPKYAYQTLWVYNSRALPGFLITY